MSWLWCTKTESTLTVIVPSLSNSKCQTPPKRQSQKDRHRKNKWAQRTCQFVFFVFLSVCLLGWVHVASILLCPPLQTGARTAVTSIEYYWKCQRSEPGVTKNMGSLAITLVTVYRQRTRQRPKRVSFAVPKVNTIFKWIKFLNTFSFQTPRSSV